MKRPAKTAPKPPDPTPPEATRNGAYISHCEIKSMPGFNDAHCAAITALAEALRANAEAAADIARCLKLEVHGNVIGIQMKDVRA